MNWPAPWDETPFPVMLGLENQTRGRTHPTLTINATHDWAASVDRHHRDRIRSEPHTYAPVGGLLHLLLEVLAYANDEAESLGRQDVCALLSASVRLWSGSLGRPCPRRQASDPVPVR